MTSDDIRRHENLSSLFSPPLFRVLEAIQIKTKGPSVNRDKGLDLDPVWDTLLQKRGGAK